MIVFPREEPVLENLNSYYLNGSKLLEHYQGHLVSGVLHFKSAAAEGAIFFDRDGLLEGACEGRLEKLRGKEAVERLIHGTNEDNYNIGVFKIEGDELYYWTSILGAKRLYEDLSVEFTDLEGLIRKMALEKLSGFIEISLTGPVEAGLIFFRSGLILGGAYSGEFTYRNRKIHFKGDADKGRVTEGLLSALKGLAEENGMEAEFGSTMEGWLKKHGKSLKALGVKP